MTNTEPAKSQYPESEKLSAASTDRAAISEFLEFVGYEHGIALCAVEEYDDHFYPVHDSDRLIMLFLGVDRDKLEAERRAMLDAIRKES